MAKSITVFIDDTTHVRLKVISKKLNRSIDDLARTSIEEAALDFFRGGTDPAKERGEK